MKEEERQLFMRAAEALPHLRQMSNYFNKDHKDPRVWEELEKGLEILNKGVKAVGPKKI